MMSWTERSPNRTERSSNRADRSSNRTDRSRDWTERSSDTGHRTRATIAAALLSATALAGCLRATSFACQDDGACGAGRCETSVGFCSFVDDTCTSGHRFGDLSGPYANQCVGGGDAGVDGDAIDAPMGCPPSGYVSLNGSVHKYKLRAAASWSAHKTACAADGGFLAVPDDAPELMAILQLSATTTWIGVNDQVQEGVYVTVLGAPATFLPWAAGEPDNGPANADCVVATTAQQLDDERCTSSFAGVCECAP
jgi:lectin-like protein